MSRGRLKWFPSCSTTKSLSICPFSITSFCHRGICFLSRRIFWMFGLGDVTKWKHYMTCICVSWKPVVILSCITLSLHHQQRDIKLMSGSLGFVFVFSVNAVSGFFLSASFLFLLVTNDRLYEWWSFVCLSREMMTRGKFWKEWRGQVLDLERRKEFASQIISLSDYVWMTNKGTFIPLCPMLCPMKNVEENEVLGYRIYLTLCLYG